jgi:hypothetical protein
MCPHDHGFEREFRFNLDGEPTIESKLRFSVLPKPQGSRSEVSPVLRTLLLRD